MDIQYKLLSGIDIKTVHQANLEAFSDYLIPLQPTAEQYDNHLSQNAVNFDLSVGAFAEGRMVGYSLNGFGDWNGKKTAYDAGTGVVPEFRKHGIATSMFDFLIPKLKEIGIQQMLLEVINGNDNAIRLYKKIGFKESRKLLFFEQTRTIELEPSKNIQIRKIDKKNWKDLERFWDGKPSWQFSTESLERTLIPPKFFGAFVNKKFVGCSSLFSRSGIVSQIAVDRNHRLNEIGTRLLLEMQSHTENDKKLKFSNLDSNLTGLIKFLGKLDYKPTMSQIEMILPL